jgi:hypothetical protein
MSRHYARMTQDGLQIAGTLGGKGWPRTKKGFEVTIYSSEVLERRGEKEKHGRQKRKQRGAYA